MPRGVVDAIPSDRTIQVERSGASRIALLPVRDTGAVNGRTCMMQISFIAAVTNAVSVRGLHADDAEPSLLAGIGPSHVFLNQERFRRSCLIANNSLRSGHCMWFIT